MSSARILIVDEERFGKICSALVVQSGYRSDWVVAGDYCTCLDVGCYDLVITSYPYGRLMLDVLADKGRSLLVLADYACDELISLLAHRPNCFYAVKPLDFSLFGDMVKNILGTKVAQ